jgi:plastin-1
MNKLNPGALDERAINTTIRSERDVNENINLCLNTGKGIGLRLNNVTKEDLMAANPQAIFIVIWQSMKLSIITQTKRSKAQLDLIKEDSEEMVYGFPPEKIALRWINYYLRKAKHPKVVNNLTTDLKVTLSRYH